MLHLQWWHVVFWSHSHAASPYQEADQVFQQEILYQKQSCETQPSHCSSQQSWHQYKWICSWHQLMPSGLLKMCVCSCRTQTQNTLASSSVCAFHPRIPDNWENSNASQNHPLCATSQLFGNTASMLAIDFPKSSEQLQESFLPQCYVQCENFVQCWRMSHQLPEICNE